MTTPLKSALLNTSSSLIQDYINGKGTIDNLQKAFIILEDSIEEHYMMEAIEKQIKAKEVINDRK